MKISLADEDLDQEITFIKNLREINKIKEREYRCDAIPHIVAHGKFVIQFPGGV